MNSQMLSALAELQRAGSLGLPSSVQIDGAKNGTKWNGTTKKGDPWTLTKNREDSYNCEC